MQVSEEIKNELIEWAPLLADAKTLIPYTVPDDYFARFPATMLHIAQAAPDLSVPTGYFENFASGMLLKVRGIAISEELDEIAPMLNRIEKKMPFSLPDGYFAHWEPILPEAQTQPAKVIKIGAGNWKQWLAAAAVVLTMGIGWQFLVNKPADNKMAASTITDAALDTLLNKVDENSLTSYLDAAQANSEFASLLMLAQDDLETGVKKLSDDELNWYLENQAIDMPES